MKKILSIISVFALVLIGCEKDPIVPITVFEDENAEVKADYTSATITWSVTSDATIDAFMLEYATDSAFSRFEILDMDLPDEQVRGRKERVRYNSRVSLSGLSTDTKYFFRIRMRNPYGEKLSDTFSFRTKKYNAPSVRTDSVTNVTITSAQLYGTLTEWGTDTKPAVGFCYATHKEPTVKDTYVKGETVNDSSFTYYAKELKENTTYYVRAVAENAKGVSYGSEISFVTVNGTVPEMGHIYSITISYYTEVELWASVQSDGGWEITECGFCYNTDHNPTIDNFSVPGTLVDGNITALLTGLTDETVYYVRAYAKNIKGIAYTKETEFETDAFPLPEAATGEVTNITCVSMMCGGVAGGGTNIVPLLEYGICYSVSPNPTIDDGKVVTENVGGGNFTCDLVDLEEETTYYIRAFATNQKGTVYGDQVTATTLTYTLPDVTTNEITSVGSTTIVCGGTVSSDGLLPILERGVCYSISPNPSIDNLYCEKVVAEGDTGSFRCSINDLQKETRYYIRAYATNKKGTAYGEQMEVTTLSEGTLSGVFSVSATKKVRFSQGNLQFNAVQGYHECSDGTTQPGTWRFAEHQYDYVGEGNSNIAADYNGWIDLFGWGTSGYNEKYPYMTSSKGSDYGNGTDDIAQTKYDWGKYNAISNGGNTPDVWRTLTRTEWLYVTNHRENINSLCMAGMIEDIHGMILLPDDFVAPEGLNPTISGKWTGNVYTKEEWLQLEAAGAIFLPTAGYRFAPSSYRIAEEKGTYWTATSTYNGYGSAYYLLFNFTNLGFTRGTEDNVNCARDFGYSVRLVQDVK